MPEVSKDAKVLIDISFQALDRAKKSDERNKILDCTVTLVFAGFFIEANLNQIIEKMGKEKEMLDFWGYKEGKKLGLQDKLAWFYNSFAAHSKINLKNASKTEKNDLKKELYEKLRVNFSGFDEIYNFRNDIAHGKIDSSTANINDAERLRKQAKNIVDELFNIAERVTGQPIERTVTYNDATS